MTTLIVDGYNAMNAIPHVQSLMGKDLHAAREVIVSISREYARSSGYITDVRVVFDGDDRYRYLDKINIPRGRTQVFSRTGKGDDKVIEIVKKHSEKGKVVVASNDNYVRNMSRGYNASLIDADELAPKKKPRSGGAGKKISGSLKRRITEEYKRHLGL